MDSSPPCSSWSSTHLWPLRITDQCMTGFVPPPSSSLTHPSLESSLHCATMPTNRDIPSCLLQGLTLAVNNVKNKRFVLKTFRSSASNFWWWDTWNSKRIVHMYANMGRMRIYNSWNPMPFTFYRGVMKQQKPNWLRSLPRHFQSCLEHSRWGAAWNDMKRLSLKRQCVDEHFQRLAVPRYPLFFCSIPHRQTPGCFGLWSPESHENTHSDDAQCKLLPSRMSIFSETFIKRKAWDSNVKDHTKFSQSFYEVFT